MHFKNIGLKISNTEEVSNHESLYKYMPNA